MSDTTAAIAILPFLILLTLTLECLRIATIWVLRSPRSTAHQVAERSPEQVRAKMP